MTMWGKLSFCKVGSAHHNLSVSILISRQSGDRQEPWWHRLPACAVAG